MSRGTNDGMRVVSVNISEETGTPKQAVPEITLDANGARGDAHAGAWHRQISLLGMEEVERFSAQHARTVHPGEFAENITTDGIDLSRVAIFDRLTIGPAELEVTQIGKRCHGAECAIFREVGDCIMPRQGIFCRVLKGGPIRSGDAISWQPRALRFRIVTVSDRASRGEYEDRSGPRVEAILAEHFHGTRWHVEFAVTVVPDDAARIVAELTDALDGGVDVIVTTGGTGVGPRDVTPEATRTVVEKTIPGIMERIRTRFGADNPKALLSRGIAGTVNQTLFYNLPGSVRAVEEYMAEILGTLEHLLCMLHGLDVH